MNDKVVENIYPRLQNTPTAPNIENEYTDLNTNVSDYRLKHIKDLKDYLEYNSQYRHNLSKKYSKATDILHYTNYGLNFVSATSGVASVTTLSTIVLLPVSIALGAISGATSILNIALGKLNKKLKIKEQKHREIYNLSEIKLNTIESLLNKALQNNCVDDNEFQLILDEEKKFKQHKEYIRRSKNKSFYEDLKEEGRNEMKTNLRESVRKLLTKVDS